MARILVIEDDTTLGELMGVVLEDAGHAVSVSTGPDDLPSGPFDCILTDLVTVTVYELDSTRAWVRTLTERYPGTPVVVVTAHAGALADTDALAVRSIVLKPFDVEALLAAVREVTS